MSTVTTTEALLQGPLRVPDLLFGEAQADQTVQCASGRSARTGTGQRRDQGPATCSPTSSVTNVPTAVRPANTAVAAAPSLRRTGHEVSASSSCSTPFMSCLMRRPMLSTAKFSKASTKAIS